MPTQEEINRMEAAARASKEKRESNEADREFRERKEAEERLEAAARASKERREKSESIQSLGIDLCTNQSPYKKIDLESTMDWDDRFNRDNNASFLSWIRRYDHAREQELTDWASLLHPDRLACKLTTHKRNDSRGAYNLGCKVEFENGEKWIVRFPMVGKVVNADEKIEIEVATMNLIRQQTTIPIPNVKAWGLAADNPLGIGPFIMMDFIEGVTVDDILQDPDARIMRQDVSESVIEAIFRQMVGFLLQLQKLDFSSIGSLTSKSETNSDGFTATLHSRPMTKKSHDFLLEGGIDVFGPRDKTFASTTEYFHHVIDGDLQHLHDQPNSVDDERDAREKYIYFNIMKSLVSRHVLRDHDMGPFKLICDDLQPTNMIINNEQDMKVIGVFDWEWSYTAPVQLVHSTPSWLLIESPNAWSSVDERLVRFNQHLDLYSRILAEEERKILGEEFDEGRKPSSILQACQEDGRQWFHMIILRGFNGPACVPFTKLREQTKDWDELVSAIPEEDIESFVSKKMADLRTYKDQMVEIEQRYNIALGGGLEDLNCFLSKNRELLALDDSRHQWQSWTRFS
ncbi:phosphotransferase enzyme family protein [Fusarium langsethiae]|uniref:Phosphotransferase enzyme family protein n=1 Tax=Fusarium langsethiae TaxID=179993 RepID=A0A0M9EM27_FUSLA|nr:phosphotransferase enzyme family protein [Fusarium langsethiae]